MNTRADMHTHTYYSDGTLSPAALVAEAKRNGVGILAVTDHDNMLACTAVHNLCKEQGITHIYGIEISAYAGDTKVHMLGYGLNSSLPAFREYYQKSVLGAEERTADILAKLKQNGITLSMEEVKAELYTKEQPIHASHIARAAVQKRYAENPWKFYMQWLNGGMPAYSNICRPTPQNALAIIHACGGFCSLAHPGRLTLEKEDQLALIKTLKSDGLDGIEACYSTHTATETAYYKEIAKSLSLLITGGSDTHSVSGNRKVGTPVFYPAEELLQKLGIEISD